MVLFFLRLLSRGNSKLLRIPPYLSAFCVLVGIAWLFLLPLNDYSRRTYISENALLPGQVHTYFAGSDQNVFRGFKHEVDALAKAEPAQINAQLEEYLTKAGLKVARQKYEYHAVGETIAGENVYGILQAPRGDATEAIVLVAAWRNVDGVLNQSGVALLLTLARYLNRWSLWSKDIIILFTPDSRAGPQAWVDAYHDAHFSSIASLPLKSGALQGAIAIDYPQAHRFKQLHIVYDGVNGQLPNLDLFNTVTNIANEQMRIPITLQQMWQHNDSYEDRLKTMLRGMLRQGLGHASGPHSAFIPYHVDAITLQPFGEGWEDEMAMGRVIESTVRSLNNLLEHLHQSFFFYLLMERHRFVSIGTYLPSAMLVATSFTIMAIYLWVLSGQKEKVGKRVTFEDEKKEEKSEKAELEIIQAGDAKAIVPVADLAVEERQLLLPLTAVSALHFLGAVPLNLFSATPAQYLAPTFHIFTAISALLPLVLSIIITALFQPTKQHYALLSCFSLLFLGMVLSALATLNFSLSLFIGLLATPLSFIRPLGNKSFLAIPVYLLLVTLSPPVVGLVGAEVLGIGEGVGGRWRWKIGLNELLVRAAWGREVEGVVTGLLVWCVWWPAWVIGAMVVVGRPKRSA